MKEAIRLLCAAGIVLFISSSIIACQIDSYISGNVLADAGNYDWWYGCSPTSVGMLLGWYDRNGYSNLIPGGVAETSTFGNPSAIVNNIIASSGHIRDFYSGLDPVEGYKIKDDDVVSPLHSFDCLADFMGTSQDVYGNSNGSTVFYFYSDNSPLSYLDIYSAGPDYYNSCGMYGIAEYIEFAGYQVTQLYNQYISGYNIKSSGFTYEQYKAEIDAGRGVLIQVKGHTMYGYGYIDGTDTIRVYDTWGPEGENPGTMTWGGSYAGMEHYGVTVLELAAVPEPASIIVMALGSLIFLRNKKRKFAI
ncbi:MAG: PEP-CTERM sorting domain-containing protein [Phycisphaerales bacterium]